MLVVVAFVFGMPVAVMNVVHMVSVLHRLVGTVRAAVLMLRKAMLGVDFLCHFTHFRLLRIGQEKPCRGFFLCWGDHYSNT